MSFHLLTLIVFVISNFRNCDYIFPCKCGIDCRVTFGNDIIFRDIKIDTAKVAKSKDNKTIFTYLSLRNRLLFLLGACI